MTPPQFVRRDSLAGLARMLPACTMLCVALVGAAAAAEKRYGLGVSDSEIRDRPDNAWLKQQGLISSRELWMKAQGYG